MIKNQSISRNSFLLSLFFSLILFTSCGEFEDEEVTVGTETAFGIRHDKQLADYESVAANVAPYNGTEYPNFESVVNFTYSLDGGSEPEFVASGVLVAPDWILTAGHNFFDSQEQSSPPPVSGIKINIGTDPNNPSATLAIEQLVFHPTWINESEVIVGANDFCLVQLANPINDIEPAILEKNSDEIVGSQVWFCGYGDYSARPNQDPDLYSKRHAINNMLDRVVDGITSRTASAG